MWKTVCRNCGWTSGETYLRSVAEAIGKVHEEDQPGHRVSTKEIAKARRTAEPKEDSVA